MPIKDILLALCVVISWGINFVVIKTGLHDMPPFLLAGLRFVLVVFPAIFFIKAPKIPIKWLVAYGMTISFGQFAFLFLAIKLGMPAGIASLVIQAQAFFTVLLGALILSEKLKWNHIIGILVASAGMLVLVEAGLDNQSSSGITGITLLLTLGAAISWALGNITNKLIMRNTQVPVMSLVVWSALIPIIPFFACSWLYEGKQTIIYSLVNISATTIISLIYLAFIATIIGYAIWGDLLKRYETWRVAPLALLVPVVGILSAAMLLNETLSLMQIVGVAIIIAGLLLNVFGGILTKIRMVQQDQQ